MSIDGRHYTFPDVSQLDILNADVDDIIEGTEDHRHKQRLQELRSSHPKLVRELLHRAYVKSEGSPLSQEQLLDFATFALDLVNRAVEREQSPQENGTL